MGFREPGELVPEADELPELPLDELLQSSVSPCGVAMVVVVAPTSHEEVQLLCELLLVLIIAEPLRGHEPDLLLEPHQGIPRGEKVREHLSARWMALPDEVEGEEI